MAPKITSPRRRCPVGPYPPTFLALARAPAAAVAWVDAAARRRPAGAGEVVGGRVLVSDRDHYAAEGQHNVDRTEARPSRHADRRWGLGRVGVDSAAGNLVGGHYGRPWDAAAPAALCSPGDTGADTGAHIARQQGPIEIAVDMPLGCIGAAQNPDHTPVPAECRARNAGSGTGLRPRRRAAGAPPYSPAPSLPRPDGDIRACQP